MLSVCVILNHDINTFSLKHNRKERPDWNLFFERVGLNRFFSYKDIDVFAYADSPNSYTATRLVASFMKGLSVALTKPLIVIADIDNKYKADDIAKKALKKYISSDDPLVEYNPRNANPKYSEDVTFKKINE